MSGNTFTCRDRYFNYGSYLRSRGYDKEICNLIVAIEQGQIPIGPIYPGNCSKGAATVIKGNVNIVPCNPSTDNTSLSNVSGQLTVTGGYIGPGGIDVSNGTNIPSQVAHQAQGYGIQSYHGISSIGPIYQQTDCSHSNWFGAKDHVFTGVPGGDCSSNVFIRGNLFVDGDTYDLKGFIGETLSLVTLPGNSALGTLNTFKSPLSNGNMVDMYAARLFDVASVSGADQWKNFLAFAVDGNSDQTQIDVSGIDASGGMSNVMGHMRGFRGLTITNPPSSGPVDIQWNPDISGTSRAIDAYGSIRVQPGNTGAPGNIDISGGQFRIFQNDISNVVLFSNGDASFNGRVSCYDLSVSNIATFGASTTYIDTSNVNTSYVTVDNSLNTKFIYAPLGEDLYINAFDGGTHSDIYMNAINIFMDSDLSVNDVSSSNINNTGLIVTHDLSVNSHASIYDLSVGIITIVDGEFTDISVNHHASIYDLSVTHFMVVDGDISANGHISGIDISASGIVQGGSLTDGIASLSAGALSNATTVTASGLVTAGSGKITDLSVNTLQSTVGANLTIKAGITGTFQDIYMNANNIFMDSDLSVNDISSSNINNTGLINTNSIIAQSMTINDISTNHISVYDLSVTHFLVVDGDISANGHISGIDISSSNIIETYDLSVNHHASIYDLSVVNMHTVGTSTTIIDTNHIQANSGEFIDISVNNHASIFDLSVGNITIVNGEFIDISVNHHAYIYDLSVNGDSVFTGNFLINNTSTDLSAIQILTNGSTNDNITIWNNQGDKDDSILIKSNVGGVNISAGSSAPITFSAGSAITFSASDIIMSNSDLSAGDISANNIQANGYITSSSDITTTSFIYAESAIITDLLTTDLLTVTGSGNIPDLSVNTLQSTAGADLAIKAGITGTFQDIKFSASNIIMSSSDLSANDISANNIQANGYITSFGDISANGAISGVSLTDGTATLSGGALTGATTVTASGNVMALNFTLDSGGGNLIDLSSNVTNLDTSMAIVEKVASLRYRADNSPVVSYTGTSYNGIKSFNISDISDNLSISQTGLIAGQIKILHTGIYSYNLQLACTTHASIASIDLAINNNSVNSPGISNVNIPSAGSTGGVNRTYVEGIDFTPGSINTISLSGISKFTNGNLVQPYIKIAPGGVGHFVTLDNLNESIFSMALLYATD